MLIYETTLVSAHHCFFPFLFFLLLLVLVLLAWQHYQTYQLARRSATTHRTLPKSLFRPCSHLASSGFLLFALMNHLFLVLHLPRVHMERQEVSAFLSEGMMHTEVLAMMGNERAAEAFKKLQNAYEVMILSTCIQFLPSLISLAGPSRYCLILYKGNHMEAMFQHGTLAESSLQQCHELYMLLI